MSRLIRTLLLLSLILPACGAGCSRVGPRTASLRPPAPHVSPTCDEPPPPLPPPSPVEPQPQVSTEADYWDAMAELVEQGLVNDTDVLLKIADHLKAAGHLSDLSRLEAWRPRRVDITDANRTEVVRTLRSR